MYLTYVEIENSSVTTLLQYYFGTKTEKVRDRIKAELTTRVDLGQDTFTQAHSFPDCRIFAEDLGMVQTRALDIDFGVIIGSAPGFSLRCETHSISSCVRIKKEE